MRVVRVAWPIVVCAGCFGSCSDQTGKGPPPLASVQGTLSPLEHDFGVIPHGESRQHEFALDLTPLAEPFAPLRVHLECSCGHADLRIRHRDGTERFVDGAPTPANVPGRDEQLIVHVQIDTRRKEAVDLPIAPARGFVVLQSTADPQGTTRVQWPMLLRFGVDSPVELRPFATLDFGRIATSQTGELITSLRGDENHRDIAFGPVTSSDPNLTVTLEPAADRHTLRAHCRPSQLGNQRAAVTIGTSLPNYEVRLEATWKVVPDLEATPLPKISFRAKLSEPQTERDAEGQFVLVSDHDTRRSAEFTVQQIVGADGRDRTSNFVTALVPVAGRPRQHRLFVRYAGGLSDLFRGTVVLTKNGSDGPFLPIELAVIPIK
jgi:hypothetical protein